MTLGLAFAARVVEEQHRGMATPLAAIVRKTVDTGDPYYLANISSIYHSAAGLVLAAEAAARREK